MHVDLVPIRMHILHGLNFLRILLDREKHTNYPPVKILAMQYLCADIHKKFVNLLKFTIVGGTSSLVM